jgi:hypothetical protein
VPGNLGGLGSVLGQVGRHRVVGDVAVDRNPDGSDVELVTPADLLPLQSARVEFGLDPISRPAARTALKRSGINHSCFREFATKSLGSACP